MELAQRQRREPEAAARHPGPGVEHHAGAAGLLAQGVGARVAGERHQQRVDAHLAEQPVLHHVAQREVGEPEPVGVGRQLVLGAAGVEERLEVLDEVEAVQRLAAAGGQHVGGLPAGGHAGVQLAEAVVHRADLGAHPRPSLADRGGLLLDPAAVAVVHQQHAPVAGVLQGPHHPEHRRVPARAGGRRRAQPADGDRPVVGPAPGHGSRQAGGVGDLALAQTEVELGGADAMVQPARGAPRGVLRALGAQPAHQVRRPLRAPHDTSLCCRTAATSSSATRSCWASVMPGNIGNERISPAARSATGKLPTPCPSPAKAGSRWTGVG